MGRFSAPTGEVLTVVTRDAATLKFSLFQVTDVSQVSREGDPCPEPILPAWHGKKPGNLLLQYGSIEEAANLLVPKGSRVFRAQAIVLDRGSKDTGTVLGKIDLAPRTYYRYDFVGPSGQYVTMSAAAILGRVFVAGNIPCW